jgi:hypothetical protein
MGFPKHHEYLRETLGTKSVEWLSCQKSNLFACTGCRYCWSCHWKKEKEEIEMNPQITLKAL